MNNKTKSKFSFRKATESDVRFLLNLRMLTMHEYLIKANVAMDKTQHLARIYEAFSDSYIIQYQGESIGLLKLGIVNQCLHIRQFQIMPAYQNKGIGTQVLKVVKYYGRKLKRDITLNVLLKNPAKNLYLDNSFKVISQNDFEFKMKFTEAGN